MFWQNFGMRIAKGVFSMRKLIVSTLLMTAGILRAGIITPDSYSLNTPAYGWAQDSNPQKLTNGQLAADFNPPSVLATLPTGFVGFNVASDITFNFLSSVTIANVTLHGVRWTNAAVEVPAQVKINGTDTFAITQGDHANKDRYTLSFNSSAGWTGSSLNFYASTYNGVTYSQWMLFDEVTFTTAEPRQTHSVPDNGSSLLLCGASIGALAVLRRRLMR
jgi:hypothetical protein